MIGSEPICMECKHFDYKNLEGLTCKAFPNGIPDDILMGENDHKKPLKKQDNDIVYEEKKQ